ncbi:MAG: carboxypeptidase-like regulatory domain-containing protein, partial [Chitinophagaceae bacterium]|nr:carboxypeptidase-like regulatory domain-containing protein [Chitinophagaceae bacterium]
MKKIFILLILFVALFHYANAQQKHIVKGVIKDSKEAPVANVTIKVKGTTIATISANDGTFTINVQGNSPILRFSAIGYADAEVNVGAENYFNVTLQETSENLNEVVVVGYGTTKKKDLTGAV